MLLLIWVWFEREVEERDGREELLIIILLLFELDDCIVEEVLAEEEVAFPADVVATAARKRDRVVLP